jgi:hypothetical protein
MVATITINRLTGPAGTIVETDITSINTRVNADDSHSVAGTTNPIEIPSGADNYSYWCTTQLDATVAPDNLVDNLEWYTDGSNTYGTGVTCVVAQAARASYTQATGTPGVTGTVLNNTNYTGGTLTPATPTDAFAYVTGAPLAVTGSTTTTGAFGDMVIYQVVVANTASPGDHPPGGSEEPFTWRYDET